MSHPRYNAPVQRFYVEVNFGLQRLWFRHGNLMLDYLRQNPVDRMVGWVAMTGDEWKAFAGGAKDFLETLPPPEERKYGR